MNDPRRLLGILPILVPLGLGACGNLARLSEIGRPPEMSQISDPTQARDYRPLTMPTP
ncbi:MAG: flagellar basal body L-ring protein, partial [Gluconacetobacter diazotrophicus]|nr:flagellar basal body L-ring protein [Gluconacetobacter diazotrophicus]